jgi:predicted TIM-barrel fold metal-dependent hydrolase
MRRAVIPTNVRSQLSQIVTIHCGLDHRYEPDKQYASETRRVVFSSTLGISPSCPANGNATNALRAIARHRRRTFGAGNIPSGPRIATDVGPLPISPRSPSLHEG